jgi:hypothetical protein
MSSEIKQFKKNNLLKEVITLALFEQDQMGAPAPAGGQAPAPAPNMGLSPAIPDPGVPDPNAPPAQGAQSEEMTLDSMIERLNVIRGGKSFTDPEIYGQLTSYFKTLTPENKTIIDGFLQSVSKVMIDVRQGSTQEAPPQDPTQPAPPGNSGQPPIAPQTTQPPAGAVGAPPQA